MTIDQKSLKELIKLLIQNDLTELEVESKGQKVRLKRNGSEPVVHQAPISIPPAALYAAPPIATAPADAAPKKEAAKTETKDDANLHTIRSPFVGTFYRAPSPDVSPFVNVGSSIKTGMALCIVEAMKLMNEIESDVSGTVQKILVENGKPVEYGEPLFLVKLK